MSLSAWIFCFLIVTASIVFISDLFEDLLGRNWAIVFSCVLTWVISFKLIDYFVDTRE